MKKRFKIMSLIIMFVLVFSTPVFAANNCSYIGSSVSVSSQDQNFVIFNLTVKDSSDSNAWLNFGDGTGISLTNGTGHVQHFYSSNGSYTAILSVNNYNRCQTSVFVSEQKRDYYCFSNQICATSINLNRLTVQVDANNNSTKLDWGDGSSVVLSRGSGQYVSHDYAYTPWGSNIYILRFGDEYNTITATFTVNDTKQGTSTFVVNQTTCVTNEEATKIIDWTPSSNSYTNPCFSGNEWKIDNIVILPINTEIHDRAGVNFKVINFVQNSFWLAKVVSGPKHVDGYTWWKIQMANGQSGWVIQVYPSTPLF